MLGRFTARLTRTSRRCAGRLPNCMSQGAGTVRRPSGFGFNARQGAGNSNATQRVPLVVKGATRLSAACLVTLAAAGCATAASGATPRPQSTRSPATPVAVAATPSVPEIVSTIRVGPPLILSYAGESSAASPGTPPAIASAQLKSARLQRTTAVRSLLTARRCSRATARSLT